MLKDVLYNSKVLDSLFTESDFSFLNETDSEMLKLNEYLKKQKIIREHIINFVNQQESFSSSYKPQISKDSAECFELINQNIRDIYYLQELFQDLEKQIVDYIVDSENGTTSTANNISEIKPKINSYFSQYKNIMEKARVNDEKIQALLDKLNINIDVPIADREVIVNLGSISTVSEIDNNDITDNLNLIVSEREGKVFLPYTKEEILGFMKKYPNDYHNGKDVIEQEFVVPLSAYTKHPTLSRFREGYALIRDREMKSIMDAFKYSIDLMFKYELNPAIIAACKSEKQLEDYLQCLSYNKLDDFKHFTIKFEINPLSVKL